VHDYNHVIDWTMMQVEPEGEFQRKPKHILDRRETLFWNRVIMQVKVQWNHFGADGATW
jgi:hypothetical protein